ncbi:hypothetical protein C8R46DRAFT_1042949 [Mycena filopes]|nr:hypothetical protein C8R46DRAFT_1042949 [Mycena filopes]
MRFSTLTITIVAAASVALAAPAPFKRGINCPAADKDGTALSASTSLVEDGNQFAECTYADAGPCTYFFADGSFSSGSSTCPKGLPQDDASNTPVAGGSTGSTASTGTASAGAIDSSIVCPSSDKDGTPLTASSSFKDDDGNEFAQCTYKDAGPCAFFFADGSFSSGSSTCPKGLPQTGAAAPPPVTTTQAPPPVTTTQAPPPVTTTQAPAPPPVTTTQAPPPPATTSSTPAPITSTSTSTFFSTVQPSASPSVVIAPAPPATTSTPVVVAPVQSSVTDDVTTVVVQKTSTPAPTDGAGGAVANSGLGDGSTNGAVAVGRGSVGALVPTLLLLVLGALL